MTTSDELRRTLSRMESGECRFVLERWIHVYCHAPCVEWIDPQTGRPGWKPGPRYFKVVWWGRAHADQPWGDERSAVAGILEALAAGLPTRSPANQPTPPAKPTRPAQPTPPRQPTQRSLFA
jgi:hypothetical protein